ncbi:MAG: transcriptional regulator [Actinobacteria bacterium]|nr:transcriptional regulator [Actinomycetota bacterium]
MNKADLTLEELRSVGAGAFFRPSHAEALGISFYMLQRMVEQGLVEKVARGLYRLNAVEPTEHYSMAAVCALVPRAVVCLLSALHYHGIGTRLSREIWIAIPHKARAPRIHGFPVRIVRFSGPSEKYGVVPFTVEGVPTRITSPARTVVDCFRFRRLVGKETALEALRETLREGKASVDEIMRAAEVCGARALVVPYLEGMA